MMKSIVPLTVLLALFSLTMQVSGQSWPRFEAYKVKIYKGRIHNPEWIRLEDGNIWRDAFGKSVESPKINFAGKYFVTSHGCGNYCRYYTITDLSSGLDLIALDPFMSEPSTGGNESYVELVMRANSRLLVAQYHVKSTQGDECRERAFKLEGKKLIRVTKTRRRCTAY